MDEGADSIEPEGRDSGCYTFAPLDGSGLPARLPAQACDNGSGGDGGDEKGNGIGVRRIKPSREGAAGGRGAGGAVVVEGDEGGEGESELTRPLLEAPAPALARERS